jgi:hypothetical protein
MEALDLVQCAVLDGHNRFDNFILDNVVIFFQTRGRVVGGGVLEPARAE